MKSLDTCCIILLLCLGCFYAYRVLSVPMKALEATIGSALP
jgi:hypothetical protein